MSMFFKDSSKENSQMWRMPLSKGQGSDKYGQKSPGQSRFLEAPLVRQADGELKKNVLTWLYSKTLQIPISIINSSHLHNPIRTWKSKNVKSWSKIQLVGRIYPRIDLTSFFRGMSTFIKTNCIMKNEQKLGKTRVSESTSFEKILVYSCPLRLTDCWPKDNFEGALRIFLCWPSDGG
jgi:hypothetical protein